jgi:hypothetical protein
VLAGHRSRQGLLFFELIFVNSGFIIHIWHPLLAQVVYNLFGSATADRVREDPLATTAINKDVLLTTENDKFSMTISTALLTESDGFRKIFTVRVFPLLF